MVINNKDLSTKIRFGFMIAVLVYLVLIVLSVVLHWFKSYVFILSLSGLFVLALIYFFIRGYNYILFNSDGTKIILRHMPLQPLLYGNYSIEIPKSQFIKYEIKKKYFGLRTSIVLYQKTDKGLSKYPPVSIATLDKSEKRDLLENLSRLQNN